MSRRNPASDATKESAEDLKHELSRRMTTMLTIVGLKHRLNAMDEKHVLGLKLRKEYWGAVHLRELPPAVDANDILNG